jgi:hypothetical protein
MWTNLKEQEPPEFGYYLTCDVESGVYTGELLWKPCYNHFVETKINGKLLDGLSFKEEPNPDVTHWMKSEDMLLPQADLVIEFQKTPDKLGLTKIEARVLDNLLAGLPDLDISKAEQDLIDKLTAKLFDILED